LCFEVHDIYDRGNATKAGEAVKKELESKAAPTSSDQSISAQPAQTAATSQPAVETPGDQFSPSLQEGDTVTIAGLASTKGRVINDVGEGVKVDQFGFLHKIASGKDLNPNDAGIQAGHNAITALIAKAESNLVKGILGSVDDFIKQSRSLPKAILKAKAFNNEQKRRIPNSDGEATGDFYGVKASEVIDQSNLPAATEVTTATESVSPSATAQAEAEASPSTTVEAEASATVEASSSATVKAELSPAAKDTPPTNLKLAQVSLQAALRKLNDALKIIQTTMAQVP
jgi:hypothetical protein